MATLTKYLNDVRRMLKKIKKEEPAEAEVEAMGFSLLRMGRYPELPWHVYSSVCQLAATAEQLEIDSVKAPASKILDIFPEIPRMRLGFLRKPVFAHEILFYVVLERNPTRSLRLFKLALNESRIPLRRIYVGAVNSLLDADLAMTLDDLECIVDTEFSANAEGCSAEERDRVMRHLLSFVDGYLDALRERPEVKVL